MDRIHASVATIGCSFLVSVIHLGVAVDGEVIADGTYLLRLLFVRHGYSCANVAWSACTTNSERLTPKGMGEGVYKGVVNKFDKILAAEAPESMVGMNKPFGIKPAGWQVPGSSKTPDGTSDECLLKVVRAGLVDNQYDELGDLVAVSNLVRDPHITACHQHLAIAAGKVLSEWLEREDIKFDLIGSSSLKRAIETVELMYMKNPYRAAIENVQGIFPLPYINEINGDTPFEAENFPYPLKVQVRQIREIFGEITHLDETFAAQYPREAQQWDKFKVVLALNVLPFLTNKASDPQAYSDLAAILENGDFRATSSWPQVRDDPIRNITVGAREYLWRAPTTADNYGYQKGTGAREFVLGIGSHANFLSEYCWHGERMPNNLAVLEKKLQVQVVTQNGNTRFEVSESLEPCELILETPGLLPRGSLTKSDLGPNCETPFDVSVLIDIMPEPADGEPSVCMARATPVLFALISSREVTWSPIQIAKMIMLGGVLVGACIFPLCSWGRTVFSRARRNHYTQLPKIDAAEDVDVEVEKLDST